MRAGGPRTQRPYGRCIGGQATFGFSMKKWKSDLVCSLL
jgi:hypothetical protein